jgi:hypothetical protein
LRNQLNLSSIKVDTIQQEFSDVSPRKSRTKKERIMIINPSSVQAAYQTTAPTAAGIDKNSPVYDLEVTSFESLLSDSDKRTIAAMDSYAKQNGIPENELDDIKTAIMFEKAFAQKDGRQIPDIDRDLLGTIAAGADAGRLDMDSRYVKMMLADFNQLQGISIKA